MPTFATWNTLEEGEDGAFSKEWGCPLEIQRAQATWENNSNSSSSLLDIQEELTRQRMERVKLVLDQEITHADIWFLQESTSTSLPIPLTTKYASVDACETASASTIFPRIWHETDRWQLLQGQVTENPFIPACMATFQNHHEYKQQQSEGDHHRNSNGEYGPPFASIWHVASVHATASEVRSSPHTRNTAVSHFWHEFKTFAHQIDILGNSQPEYIVLCGDWNVDLASMQDSFAEMIFPWGVDPTNPRHAVPPFAAASLPNASMMAFSTTHELGWLAQYDGCLVSYKLKPLQVKAHLQGFMPKGVNATLPSPWSFVETHTDNSSALVYTPTPASGLYYEDVHIPNSMPQQGLSDHLLVVTEIGIYSSNEDPLDLRHHPAIQFLMFFLLGGAVLLLELAQYIAYRYNDCRRRQRRRRRDFTALAATNSSEDEEDHYEDESPTSDNDPNHGSIELT